MKPFPTPFVFLDLAGDLSEQAQLSRHTCFPIGVRVERIEAAGLLARMAAVATPILPDPDSLDGKTVLARVFGDSTVFNLMKAELLPNSAPVFVTERPDVATLAAMSFLLESLFHGAWYAGKAFELPEQRGWQARQLEGYHQLLAGHWTVLAAPMRILNWYNQRASGLTLSAAAFAVSRCPIGVDPEKDLGAFTFERAVELANAGLVEYLVSLALNQVERKTISNHHGSDTPLSRS